MLDKLCEILGPSHVLTGADCAPYASDWTGSLTWTPLAVLRPASTAEVSAVMQQAYQANTPVVAISGRTGIAGGGSADGALVLSTERLNQIEDIRVDSRIAIVGAGVIQQTLHDAVARHDLRFPMIFGARGSACIGGMLATNAGGSNVLRYGNMRDLCLGVEAVLADGTIVDALHELHKNNAGYDLRHLLIGSEGTLGIITRAVLKLVPSPRAFATAMIATRDIETAMQVMNDLRDASGGTLDAIEAMPRFYIDAHLAHHGSAREPFDAAHPINILVELASTSQRDATPLPDGTIPLVNQLETLLADLLENGTIDDAVIAKTEAQRQEMWARRELAGELSITRKGAVMNDVAVPLDRIADFLDGAGARVHAIDPGAQIIWVSHLGDGNIHYTLWPSRSDPELKEELVTAVEDEVAALRGSFSAEHGIGTFKLGSMRRRADPAALATMRAIKRALDPRGILNPGKVLPGN